jgi:hypothetical protein
MVQRISGPGVGLPLPQNLYPSELQGAALDTGGNRICLPAGTALPVPAGEWNIGLGMYLLLQFLDPISNTWVTTASGGWEGPFIKCFSDGYNYRVANLLACPVGAVITNAGASYVQASTTISVTGGGGSTWQPIVGGQLTVSGGTLVSNGAGYGVAPLALLPAPAPPAANPNGVGGVQASGYFTIASGTVSGFTFTNPGAGYQSGFTVTAQPSPYDPNLATGITLATIAFSLTASGSLTGVVCTNSGAPLANPANITLTVSGVGSQATISPIVLQTITKASVTGAGTGYGTVGVLLTTFGGAPGTAVFSNSPETLYLAGKPRPADIGIATTGSGGTLAANALGTIYDGGFFYSAPSIAIASGAQSGSVSGATIALTMGSVPDIAVLQPGS